MFKKTRNKFLLMNLIIFSIVFVVLVLTIYMTLSIRLQADNSNKINKIASNQISGKNAEIYSSDEAEINENKEFIVFESMNNESVLQVYIDSNNKIIAFNSSFNAKENTYIPLVNKVLKEKRKSKIITFKSSKWQYKISKVIKSQDKKNNRKIIFMNVTSTYSILDNLLLIILVISIPALFFIFLSSLFFANKSLEPLKVAWRKQQDFITNASHELKTPLTIIKTNYDAVLVEKEDTIQSQIKWFEYMHVGIDQMNNLVNDLVTLSRFENLDINVNKVDFDLVEELNKVINSMVYRIEDKNIKMLTTFNAKKVVKNDKKLFNQLILILLDNAIKYVNYEGFIELKTVIVKGKIQCLITNSSDDMKKDDLEKLFERFYRKDNSYSKDDRSLGLGLSIAQEVSKKMNSSLSVSCIENESITFKITL